MRILVAAPQVPWPPQQGTALRNYHIVVQLAERHSVTVLAFGDPDAPTGPLADAGVRVAAVPPPAPRPALRRFLDLGVTTIPDLAQRLATPAMTDLAMRAVEDQRPGNGFDVIQIEGLEMAPVGHAAYAAASAHAAGAEGAPDTKVARVDAASRDLPGRPLLVYDAHNAEWLLQHRAWLTDIRRASRWHGALYSAVQTIKLRRYERSLMDAANATVAVSLADASALRSLGGNPSITVVPNGVDTDAYTPAVGPSSGAARVQAGLCVFTGKMDFRPNVDAMRWLCSAVWPLIRERHPGARLAIVGRDPTPHVLALAADDVIVTGAVDDVRPWIARAEVVIVPLRVGGGTRLKVLEAMAMAKPIAATTLAVEGLDLSDGVEALLADQPAALAAAVGRLMDDESLRTALGGRARRRAESDFRWQELVPRIEQLYGHQPERFA
jgi:glycosyltransferase involved in cell wall biosynthesis